MSRLPWYSNRYNKMCGHVTKLVAELKQMDPHDPFRIQMTDQLLDKLFDMGLIPTKKSLAQCERLAVSAFCRWAAFHHRLRFAAPLTAYRRMAGGACRW